MVAATREGNTGEAMKLPAPKLRSGTSVEEAILKRRSVREFSPDALKLDQVSQLLWSAQGVTSKEGYRAAPSAGAMYPLETYLVAGKVEGLEPGIYHYVPRGHELALHREGDARRALVDAALGQWFIEEAPASVAFSAVYKRTTRRYGERGIRYVHMDVAHAAENLHLQVVSLGLVTVVVAAFDDKKVKLVLELPGDEEPLMIMPVGKPR